MPEMTLEELFDSLMKKQKVLEKISEKLEELNSKKDEMDPDTYLEEIEKLHVRSKILVKQLEDLGSSVEALNPKNEK